MSFNLEGSWVGIFEGTAEEIRLFKSKVLETGINKANAGL